MVEPPPHRNHTFAKDAFFPLENQEGEGEKQTSVYKVFFLGIRSFSRACRMNGIGYLPPAVCHFLILHGRAPVLWEQYCSDWRPTP